MTRRPHSALLRRIPAISLFTGPGGMDLGFAREGFDVRVVVETDPAACQTLIANWPGISKRLIRKPLQQVSTDELLKAARLRVSEVGLVFGGPPCQSWCIAGNRRGLRDSRGGTVLEFCRVVREAAPLAFCIENVPGFLNHRATDVLALIKHEVNRNAKVQFEVTAQVVNAAEYGVPQIRRRAFVVGWRCGGEFLFPAPTHRVTGAPQRPWKKPAVTVGKALKGLPAPMPPSDQAARVAETIGARNRRWYGRK